MLALPPGGPWLQPRPSCLKRGHDHVGQRGDRARLEEGAQRLLPGPCPPDARSPSPPKCVFWLRAKPGAACPAQVSVSVAVHHHTWPPVRPATSHVPARNPVPPGALGACPGQSRETDRGSGWGTEAMGDPQSNLGTSPGPRTRPAHKRNHPEVQLSIPHQISKSSSLTLAPVVPLFLPRGPQQTHVPTWRPGPVALGPSSSTQAPALPTHTLCDLRRVTTGAHLGPPRAHQASSFRKTLGFASGLLSETPPSSLRPRTALQPLSSGSRRRLVSPEVKPPPSGGAPWELGTGDRQTGRGYIVGSPAWSGQASPSPGTEPADLVAPVPWKREMGQQCPRLGNHLLPAPSEPGLWAQRVSTFCKPHTQQTEPDQAREAGEAPEEGIPDPPGAWRATVAPGSWIRTTGQRVSWDGKPHSRSETGAILCGHACPWTPSSTPWAAGVPSSGKHKLEEMCLTSEAVSGEGEKGALSVRESRGKQLFPSVSLPPPSSISSKTFDPRLVGHGIAALACTHSRHRGLSQTMGVQGGPESLQFGPSVGCPSGKGGRGRCLVGLAPGNPPEQQLSLLLGAG
ncbi:hypothetical protein E2I00_019546 [Balaenoptera physalus]|uniref:Uncharacterized protein n=1 Tax=Balaenoptera physalus TaxID=9770 RepID=A0A6A1Q4M7_BALPH|nr:hypothetical protein E2I00_019546 [Balaenoptera physalus]